MTKQELVAKMQEGQAWVPGKRVKLDFGDQGAVMLDGAAQQVSEEDGAADTTIKVGWDDWQAMAAGTARRHDRVHDRQVEGRGRHVERDAAAGRAGEVASIATSRRRPGSKPGGRVR